MGVVYKANDSLSGKTIALKKVNLNEEEIEFSSRMSKGKQENAMVALTQEFKLLASMRHPNVINVLDYGFDSLGQPFLTMDFLWLQMKSM